jgi:hypothetical protein
MNDYLCVVHACRELVLELLPIRVLIKVGLREGRLSCHPFVCFIGVVFQSLVRV